MIKSRGEYKLVHKDGHEVRIGDEVTTFRGERGRLLSWSPPLTPQSTGRVEVEYDNVVCSWYPGVIDCVIKEVLE